MSKNSRLVYSTDRGRICPADKKGSKNFSNFQNLADSRSHQPKNDGIVRIRRETSGRKGKGVTTISGLDLTNDLLNKLARQLKQHCSTGGTIKEGVIEIQGDHREKIRCFLLDAGYQVKLAGG